MRGTDRLSQYEAGEFRREAYQASKAARTYKEKWLHLRKVLREYLPKDAPEHINKLIGRR